MSEPILTWERARADRFVQEVRAVLVEGVSGADTIPALLTSEQFDAIDPVNLRSSTYALFRALVKTEPFNDFAFEANWGNVSPATSRGGFKRDPFNRVSLQGYVMRSIAGFVSLPVAYLPEGYRPRELKLFAASGNNRYCTVAVFTNGAVQITAADDATPEALLSLEGITFEAAD